jgi:uncharacterized cupin superfamily protein
MAPVRRVNILAPEFDHESDRDGYRWRGMRVGKLLGAERIGASLYDLPDGEATYPYHLHHGMEEWLLVVSGTPTLRGPDGERSLRAGDVACFPAGPEGAHQVRGPGTVLILSANRTPETITYPDSGKVGTKPPGKTFRLEDAVDYWEGE